MGIENPGLRFLLACRAGGVRFDETLTIGRQQLFLSADELMTAFADYGYRLNAGTAAGMLTGTRPADPVFRMLGATALDSIDASDYEGATIIADLNDPVDAGLHERFSVVLDGGSLEHIFNFPQAIRSCMALTAVGGHLLMVTPADSYLGHGFYQFSPELLFRLFTVENGYHVKHVLLCDDKGRWFRVHDPATKGRRMALAATRPTMMYACAQRLASRDILATSPQQSDYVQSWAGHGWAAAAPESRLELCRRWLRGHGRFDPEFLRPTRL